MSSITESTMKELADTFEKIHEILIRENENNWIRGINSIRERIDESDSNSDLDKIFREVGVSYRHLNSGAGSFSDFMVWRDDFEERKKLNQEFEALANKAWKLLDL